MKGQKVLQWSKVSAPSSLGSLQCQESSAKFCFCDMMENDIQSGSQDLLSKNTSCHRGWNRWFGADLPWFACICLDQISDATRHVGACWCSRERHGACCFNRAQIAVLNTGLFCVLMPNGGIGRRVIMTCKICGGVDNGSIGYSQGCFQVSSMQVSTRIRGKAIKQVGQISG